MSSQPSSHDDYFFQHEAGGVLGESSNPLIFPFIPEAAYDSWVTIGLDEAAEGTNGESGVSILEGLEPWVEPFEAGGSLNIADALGGVWYVLNGRPMASRARISGYCSASSQRTETWTGSCISSFLKWRRNQWRIQQIGWVARCVWPADVRCL